MADTERDLPAGIVAGVSPRSVRGWPRGWSIESSLVAGCVVVLACSYTMYISDLGSAPVRLAMYIHVLANVGCNLSVAVAAWRAHGQLRSRAKGIASVVLIVHGALALWALASRTYFSRSLMLIAIAVSVIVGMSVLLVRLKRLGLRVATLCPNEEIPERMPFSGDLISDPSDLSGYDVLLLPMSAPLDDQWSQAVAAAMLRGAQVRHVAEFLEEVEGQTTVEHFDIEHIEVDRLSMYIKVKRIIDATAVIILVPILIWPFVFGCIAVFLTMGWPIFYVQDRVGLGGRVFRMYKLRTMRSSLADEVGTATSNFDPRVTNSGKFLRRYRLDELPQLLNVLRGDMSLIGPRPEQPGLTSYYTKQLPAFAYRSLMPPGVSGWAQVRSGYASNVQETENKLRYDLYYVKNASLALDVEIAVRTIKTVITGGGAR